MNQLNQLQEKLQSNVISQQEQKALKGKRGKIFKTGYANNNNPTDTSNHHTTVRTAPSETTVSSPTSPTVSSSSNATAIGKFGKGIYN